MSILIISTKEDQTTNNVIKWINYYNKDVICLTSKELFKNYNVTKELSNENEKLEVYDFNKCANKSIESVWIRRDNRIINEILLKEIEKEESIDISHSLSKELDSIMRVFLNKCDKLRWISEYDTVYINKFNILKIAKSCNLTIPDTIVTNSKKTLEKFIHKNENIITKASYERLKVLSPSLRLFQFTTGLNKNDLVNIPEKFLPSYFQEKIDKEMDIRIFYFNQQCYSMGIITESVDFAESADKNILFPMKMPEEIISRLITMMCKLNMNIGCIDMIKEKGTDRYIFIEVNPNGQFSDLSITCNEHLEMKIAQYLCHE